MLWSRYVVGYHGCDAELARKVVCREERLRASTNDYDWLGNGIYFWEGSSQRALEWAEKLATDPESSVKKPGVIGAVIDLGECLNLVEAEYLELVQAAYQRLVITSKESNSPLPQNSGHDYARRALDCAVFETLHQYVEEFEDGAGFDTVRAFFIEGEPVYPTSGIRHRDHIQICVRNPDQIIGYFLP